MLNFFKNIFSGNTDFQKLFFANEYQTLSGKSHKGILTLILILFITLLSLGFALGSLKYLKERMDDPYTNWVNLPVTPKVDKVVSRIKENFSQKAVLDSFNLKNIDEYDIGFEKFIGSNHKIYNNNRGRTFDPNSDILKKILNHSDNNVLTGISLKENSDETLPNPCGLIVTKTFLDSLEYDYKTTKKIPIAYDERNNIIIYLDILAVVKELPDLCDYSITNRMYNLLTTSKEDTGFMDNNDGIKNIFSIISNEKSVENLKSKIKSFDNNGLINKIDQEPFVIDSKSECYKYTFVLNSFLNNDSIQLISKEICTQLNATPFTNWECNSKMEGLEHPSYLSFNFKTLDKVRALKDYLKEKYDVELSMTQVEAKENFALVSNLTFIIIMVLFGFSITSIVYYVDSLLNTHLEKVKTNLGTFKAFGLSNAALISNYIKIIFSFLLISTLISFVAATLVSVVGKYIGLKIVLFDYRIFGAILILFIVSIYKSRQTIQNILAKTPGDLIYNR